MYTGCIGRNVQEVKKSWECAWYKLRQVQCIGITICQVLNTTAESFEYQKNERVYQWNLFKCQTSTFYISAYRPNLFEHLLTHAGQTIWQIWLLQHQSSKQHIGQVFFINNAFSPTSKLLTPNMYCWSCKTLVTIYWTYLGVNGIWAKSFCPQKMNNRTLFLLRDAFSGSVVHRGSTG